MEVWLVQLLVCLNMQRTNFFFFSIFCAVDLTNKVSIGQVGKKYAFYQCHMFPIFLSYD